MMLYNSFIRYFENKNLYKILLLLVLLVSLVVFKISSGITFPDSKGYWLMSESLFQYKFSSWYFLQDYYPETLRTPGYPLFLAFCQLISKSEYFVKIIQLFIYFASVYNCLQIIHTVSNRIIYKNVFLTLLIFNIQIVYYAGYISSETLSIFFVTILVRLILSKTTIQNSLILSLICYLLFLTRPAFMLFPILLFFYFILTKQKDFAYSLLFICTFFVLLVPFGIWNKYNHNQFKITPIEGGAGVAHLGFWQLKLPDGYVEPFYWGNSTSYDLTKPKFYTDEQYKDNVKLYEKEMSEASKDLSNYNSSKDSINLALMNKTNPGIFLLHNSEYTIAREKLLLNLTLCHIKEEPIYYLKSRVFHIIRYYITGINYIDLKNANSILGKAKIIYPFIITTIFIFLGLLISTLTILFKGRGEILKYMPLIAICWYAGIVHIPFSIQSRYTVPVHMIILILTSISIINVIKLKYEKQ